MKGREIRNQQIICIFQSIYENSGGKQIEKNGDNVGIMETKNDV